MRLVAIPTVLCLALLAPPVLAQHDPAAAESLFRDAKAAEARGDYKAACAQFAESQRLDPAAGTLLNQADCEEHLGAVATAWGHFVEARDGLPKGDDRIPYATQRAAALEKRVPHLVVRLPPGAPAGTKVMRGQVEIGAAALGVPLAVDPGPIVLTATPPGSGTVTKNVLVNEGETKDVTLDLTGAAPAPAPTGVPVAAPMPAAPPPTDQRASSSGDTKRTLGWVVGGVGVAGLALGAVTGVMAMGDASTVKSDCGAGGACKDQSGVDAASAGKTASTLSTVGFIGGAALAGAGVYLLLTSGPSSSTTVGAAPLPGGASLAFARSF
jgi:hypothetical protein